MTLIFKITFSNSVCPTAYITTDKLDIFVDVEGYYTPDDISAAWIKNKTLRQIFRNGRSK